MAGKKTSGTPEGVREGMKKAVTEMLVLFLLRQKSMYTYEMMADIEELSDGALQFNTLYQAIYRLKSFGYIVESDKVVSDENRIRIYFKITEEGEKYFSDSVDEYRATIAAIDHILSSDGKIKTEV